MKRTSCRVQSALPLPTLKGISPDRIHVPHLLVHEPDETLPFLTESVRRHGLLQPIGVKKKRGKAGQYELLFGYRRLIACRSLYLPKIPCLVFSEESSACIFSLCENLQRKESGDRLLSDTAARLGVSETRLASRLPHPQPSDQQKVPKRRDISLFPDETPEPERRTKGIVRDVRLVANSIDRAVALGKEAGFAIDLQKIERAREIWYHIRLPRICTPPLLFSDDFPHAS